jgi:hypothetical protein
MMFWISAILVWAWAGPVWAQAPESPELRKAQEEAARVEALVEAGALPRARLEQVRQELVDAQDAQILQKILYGSLTLEELTEPEVDQMVAAATRRLDRRKAKLEQARRLVEEGALSRLSLAPIIEDLDLSRKTLDLALSRATLLRQLAQMARAELALLTKPGQIPAPEDLARLAERYDGDGVLRPTDLKSILLAFEKKFSKPLPISARGDTAVHRALGFDHRGRVDVALDPDQPEGLWLRGLLRTLKIPFLSFRSPVPGKSTGPHIHIGPPSHPLHSGG